MTIARLKKQVEEIDRLATSGKAVKVNLIKDNKQAHLKVVGKKASRVSRKEAIVDAENALKAGSAAGDQPFTLDLSAADISDAEIVAKIKQASGLVPAAVATGVGSLPVVTITRNDLKGVWILAATCSYETTSHRLTILAGFETDLASIPRIFWSILAPEELSLAAPLFHDFIYRRGGTLLSGELNPFNGHVFKRAQADSLFLEMMTKAGIPKWKRNVAYWAVRGFAAFAWKK